MAVTQATLVYTFTRVGPQKRSKLAADVAAVPLNHTQMLPFGCTLTSDLTTTPDANTVVRTVVYALSATFNQQFPAGSGVKGPFVDLWTHVLGAGAKCAPVTSTPVVV